MAKVNRTNSSSPSRWSVKVEDLRPEGEVLVVRGATKRESSALFLRVQLDEAPAGSVELEDGSQAIAYLNICTHMGCELVRGDGGRLPTYNEPGVVLGSCPCHGTRFDLTRGGIVVLGPATADLPQLELELKGSTLVANLTQKNLDPRREAWPIER